MQARVKAIDFARERQKTNNFARTYRVRIGSKIL